MRVIIYKTQEDWKNGLGQLCDGIGDVKSCYCMTVENSDNEIELFIGNNGKVYVKEPMSKTRKFQLMDCSRILVRFVDDVLGEEFLTERLYLARVDGRYSINGKSLLEANNRVIDAAVKMFSLVDKHVSVISFPVCVKEVYNCSVYTKRSDIARSVDLLQKKDFKEF